MVESGSLLGDGETAVDVSPSGAVRQPWSDKKDMAAADHQLTTGAE